MPPVVRGPVFRSRVLVRRLMWKAELYVVAWKLTRHVLQVANQVVVCVVVCLPGSISDLAIGVEVRQDPPLVVAQDRRGGRLRLKVGYQVT